MADGTGCKCAAYDQSECGCDADWTPQELIDARAEIERLRAAPCPHVTGNVTRYCTLTPLTLTDAEREAVETAFDALQYAADELGLSQPDCDRLVATLRGLLERTAPKSDRP